MRLLSICCAWSIVSAAIVGVDFGHKFTKAMMVAPGIRFEIIPTDGGNRKDLSAIYVDPKVADGSLEDTERAYGSQIGSLCSRSPESCAANLKSLLGKTTDDTWVGEYLNRNPHFNIVPSTERPHAIAFELGRPGHSFTFSAEELAAMSLADLKERVIKALTHHPQARPIAEDIAISIPPYANQLSRLAYKDALSLANYSSVLGLVDEGCAAALAYVSDRKFAADEYNNKPVYQMIYDVGAGSTTATLFSYTAFENKTVLLDVESVGFDDSLGGDLLTQHVYDILYGKFLREFNLDESFEMPFKLASRLAESAEKAKTILSANADSKVSLESFWNDDDFKTVISRAEFEDATAKLIERINKPILDALQNSPTGPKTIADVESVILNGGATRTPFIQKQLVDFLGDGKVSKVLNADEACAYGTTIRAFQLKMITGTGSDIVLNDRILNDFEISINGSDEKQLVFSRGSSAGNTSLVNLGKVAGDKLTLGLHENGNFFGFYNVSRLSTRASELTCYADDVVLFGQFTVGEDKLFSLHDLYVQCANGKKEQAPEVDEKNSSASNSTKKFTRTKARVTVPPMAFTSLRPYTSSEKKNFLSTLAHLKDLEKDKVIFENAKNVLEGACYSLRFYIDDHYDMLSDNLGEKELEQIQIEASDMVDWVDYESDSSTLQELQEKLRSVEKIRKDLEATVRMSQSDLSLSTLRDLLSEGNELAQNVQDYLLEFGSHAKQVRERYEAEDLDFDTENEKIMKKIYGVAKKDQFDLEKHFSEFKQALKELADMTNLSEPQFEKVTPQERFDTSEAVNALIRAMVEDVQILQKQHEQRITYLLNRLEKLKERKQQKDLKAKLREEKEKEKEKEKAKTAEQPEVDESEGSVNNTESEHADSDSQTFSSNSEESTVGEEVDDSQNTQKADDHDEL